MIIKKSSQKHLASNKMKTQLQNNAADDIVAQNNPENSDNNVEENNTVSEVKDKDKNAAEQEKEIDLFDIENIDFTQRQERRRGSRRRGYRRIDDRNLVSRAQEESENIKKSAFEEGYKQGIDKASSDLQLFRDNLSKFMSAQKDVFEYIAPDILELSVEIAQKIIKKELDTDPQVIINTILDVLKTVSKSEPKITIRVKPQAVQLIKDTLPNITYQYGIESKINIVADPSIEDGGCILQTNNGIVDASIDTQLEIIKKALEGM